MTVLSSVKEIFADALERSSGDDRAAFVASACAGDERLLREVETLLASFDAADQFLTDEPGATVGLESSDGGPAREGERPGMRVGRYLLVRQIGEGGFGAVFLAEQFEPIRRKVALKIIKRGMDSSQVIARFEAERQALAMMDHPNIARVLDAGETVYARPYFVMELVDGVPITEYCDQNELSITQRMRLFVSVCRATEHAHQKGVIHRDLKPTNVLVTEQDGEPVAKIIDFGIAKATTQPLTEQRIFTECQQLLGTPQYMSPEQAELGAVDVDTRSDVYSLGVLLYELLTGATPFDPRILRKAAIGEIQRMLREENPPPPSTKLGMLGETLTEVAHHRKMTAPALRTLLRGELDWITNRAMEKERDRRYSTAGALAEDAERYLRQEPIEAGPPTTRYILRKFVARHRLILAAAAAIGGVLILGLIGTTTGFLNASKARNLAQNLATSEATQRRLAVAAGARADENRQAAEATSIFLQNMLASADPKNARGRSITVLEVLDVAAVKLDAESMAQQPRTEAALRRTLGTTYGSLGLYSKAARHLQRAVDIYRHLSDAQLQLATSLMDLGNVLKEEADYGGAELAYKEALQLFQRVAPNDHTMRSGCLSNLGNALLGKEDLAGAEALFREAIKVSRMNGGEDRFEVSAAWTNLGCVRLAAKDYDGAASFFQQALHLQRKLGNNDPQIIIRVVDLSIALLYMGKTEDADRLLAEALELAHHLYGPKHPMVARVLDAMAFELLQKEDLGPAAALIEQALEMTRNLENPGDPSMLHRLQTLARIYDKTGDKQKSQTIFWEWMAAKSDALTEAINDGRDDYASRLERGCLFARTGRFPEALDDMKVAICQKPNEFSPRYYAALLEADQGNIKGYREQCGLMTERFGKTDDPQLAARMAVAVLQAPQERLAVSTISGWINPDMDVSDQDDVVAAQKFARALFLFRTSSWNDAADAFAELGGLAHTDAMQATADVYLGMTRLQQNRSEANIAALRRTIADWESKLPQAAKQDLGESFDKWLFWQISEKEAQKALGAIP
jgi:serine/threonine protein kinase/Tfp pilus assembly protein PilF